MTTLAGGGDGGGGSDGGGHEPWRDLDLQSLAGYSDLASNISEIPNPNGGGLYTFNPVMTHYLLETAWFQPNP